MAAAVLGRITSVAEAEEALLKLDVAEKHVVKELDALMEHQTQLDIKMATFQHMLPTLHTLSTNASDLGASIARASALAESVSGKVRVLDVAKTNVYSAMRQVDDVIDLKSCVDGVQYSMNSGDFEKAAAYVHRYLSLGQAVFQEAAANSTQESSSSNAFSILKRNQEELRYLVRSKFKEAVSAGDVKSIERFFKIYPSLGLEEEGLLGFCSYLQTQVYSRSEGLLSAVQVAGQRAGLVFADMLTQLFEEIAGLIEKYYSLVQDLYGVEWTAVLIQKLQEECDGQVVKILKILQEERSLDSKVKTVSMALKSRAAVGAIRPDVLELDMLLTELSLCSSRSELYFRFLRRKLNHGSEGGGGHASKMLSGCGASLAMQELIGKYIVLENYFMSESLSKAVRMDHWDQGHLTSSMADDIFFVLQKCIKRALASSNVDCTCAMLNHARTLLEEDYRKVLETRLKASLPASTTGLDLSSMLQERFSLSSGSADTEASQPSCMVALNDVEVSIANIQKLSKEFEIESSKLVAQVGGSTADKLQSCLADLSSSVIRLKQLRQEGVATLLRVLIMPGIKETLKEFSTQEHVLTEEKLASYEVNDPFIHHLVGKIQSTLEDIKSGSLEPLYQQVALDMVEAMARALEDLILKATFNQLGGLQLDRDLRSLLGYLSSLIPWPVRDKFSRLSQMATLLSLERVSEVLDYWGDNLGPMVWRLTPSEVRTVMTLRVDFSDDEIHSLKL